MNEEQPPLYYKVEHIVAYVCCLPDARTLHIYAFHSMMSYPKVWSGFTYLGLKIPLKSSMDWMCCSPLRGKKGTLYYAFMHTWNGRNVGSLKQYLFDALVTSVLLNGALASLRLIRKSLEISKSFFLQSFFKSRNNHHTPSLRQLHLPLRSWPLKRGLLNTCLWFK